MGARLTEEVPVSTIETMFVGDEHEIHGMLREANELRRARGLPQLGPWWRVQPADLHERRRRARQRRAILRVPHRRAAPMP